MNTLLKDIRACRICEKHLPLGCRPIVQASTNARLLIIGQAPGTRVHETGIPWNDPSGDKLREWMQLDKDVFYDPQQVAIVPMGFCYPGKGKSGDLPPRQECASEWHEALLAKMPNIQLTLLFGKYALARYLPETRKQTLTETVRQWQSYGPLFLPMPHPSPRNRLWLRRNPWFEQQVVPEMAQRVAALLAY